MLPRNSLTGIETAFGTGDPQVQRIREKLRALEGGDK